jgi:hypothetical protein
MRLRVDGHGIDRVPLIVAVDGIKTEMALVRVDELVALEALLDDARRFVCLLCPEGINWDDPQERQRLFDEAEPVWLRMGGVLRGDDECFVDGDEDEGS